MDKLRLEPTAALVMQWALSLYSEEPVLRFINQLDLSSGKDLYSRCHSICDWYDQIILNRKSFLKHLIEQELHSAKEEYQLVLLGAGKSPLPLEILLTYWARVNSIFEVDVSGMEEKNRLYQELFPGFLEKLRCVEADIASSGIPGILDRPEIGYRHDLPTIILMEGISYYLSKQDLSNIIEKFKQEKDSTFIIEYMVPSRCVVKSRRHIPGEIFRIIQDACGLEEITVYTEKELRSLFRQHGGSPVAGYSMANMEFARTGSNNYFQKQSDGWIECAVGKVGVNAAQR